MTIDREFKALIPPLSKEEFEQLEANCLRDGIRDNLIVWDNNGDFVLIDGHNRYEIAQKHNLPYNHKRMEFPNREAVIEWIITNQLGRRNIDEWVKFDLTKRLDEVKRAEAHERMSAGAKGVETFPQATGKTRDAMGELIGVSGKTYDKMKKIDELGTPEIKAAVRNGEITTQKAFNLTMNHVIKPKDFIQEARDRHEQFEESKKESVVSFQDIQQDNQNKEILAIDLYKEICNAARQFDKLSLLRDEDDYEILWNNLDHEAYGDLYSRLSSTKRIINSLMDELERRKNG